MKPYFLLFCLFLLPSPLEAAERLRALSSQLKAAAQRAPAYENKEFFENLNPGKLVVLQNSLPEWNDQIAVVTDKFEDGSVRVRLVDTGKLALIKAENLKSNLSTETDCAISHGFKICKNERVFFPLPSASLDIPEAKVIHVFTNGTVVVRDGGMDYLLDAKQIGKQVQCSPQKESLCVEDYVFAEGYKDNRRFSFEGPVDRIYSHGVALVRSMGLRFPIDVMALKKRIAGGEDNRNPAIITEMPPEKPLPVVPEVESYRLENKRGN